MKLIDIPVVYICPDNNEKYKARKTHMDTLLNTIGFKDIRHFKSGTEKYPTCLVKATISILKENMNDEPVLILEDDILPFLELNSLTEIEFLEDTDAFYLGFSMYGGSKVNNIFDGPSIIEKISSNHIRIKNMLSAHAIIYKSSKYKEDIIDTLYSIIDKPGYYNDVCISRRQNLYNVHAYYYPLFYQASIFPGNTKHVEYATRFKYNL